MTVKCAGLDKPASYILLSRWQPLEVFNGKHHPYLMSLTFNGCDCLSPYQHTHYYNGGAPI